jgi:hypothetical protein
VIENTQAGYLFRNKDVVLTALKSYLKEGVKKSGNEEF